MFGIKRGGGENGHVVAVADVGSGSAAVAILLLRDGLPAQILAAERALLSYENRSEEATIKGVLTQLSTEGEKVKVAYQASSHRAAGSIDRVYAIIRAPWTKTRTVKITEQFEHDTYITQRLIEDSAHKAVAQQKDIEQDALLEASVVRVELNGYPCAEPVGKTVRVLSVAVLISECDTRVKTSVIETLAKLFSFQPTLRSGTRALLTVLREAEGRPKNCVIIDMTSEATDIISIRKAITVGHSLVPEGVRSILRRIAESAMPEETLGLLRMLAMDQTDTTTAERMNAALAKAEPELVRVFGGAMEAMVAQRRLPNELILLTHPDLARWLAYFFARIDFSQFTITMQPFAVTTLAARSLERFVVSTEGAPIDTGLSLACSLVNIEEQE